MSTTWFNTQQPLYHSHLCSTAFPTIGSACPDMLWLFCNHLTPADANELPLKTICERNPVLCIGLTRWQKTPYTAVANWPWWTPNASTNTPPKHQDVFFGANNKSPSCMTTSEHDLSPLERSRTTFDYNLSNGLLSKAGTPCPVQQLLWPKEEPAMELSPNT